MHRFKVKRLRDGSLTMHPSEAFCVSLLNSLTDGIAISVFKDTIFINKALLNIYGLKYYSEGAGRSFQDFVHPEDRDMITARSSFWLQGKTITDPFQYRICRSDGAIRNLQVFPRVISFKGQSAAMAIIRDITEISRAEGKVQRLNNKLQQLIDLCQISPWGLESFGNTICHDLRVPLIAIERSRQKLAKECAFPENKAFTGLLDSMRDNIRWMNQLIDGLVEYGSIGKYEINRTMVSVQNLVESTIDMISVAYQKRKVVLKADNLPSIYGDEKMLRRVFMNLISNAFKFTKYRETAIIEVGASEEPREIVYYVRDNGEGFDMRHKDNLFKVFGRFHSTDEFEGAGIGLDIVKRIVEDHGGRVWAESGIGEGATFFLALPRTLGAKG